MKPYYIITRENITGDYSNRVVCASADIKKVLKFWTGLACDHNYYIIEGSNDVTVYFTEDHLCLSSVLLGFFYEDESLKVRYSLETKIPHNLK